MDELRIGTRKSALARMQAGWVADRLREAGLSTRLVLIETEGDRRLEEPLYRIGGKGLFTKALDEALLDGRIELAVHSLKDLPTELPEGLGILAIPPRASPYDVFVPHRKSGRLAEAPPGALVATSSLRRAAQLRAWRPDLEITPVRGNVDTRLAKLARSTWYGLVLAEAGLSRLGMPEDRLERLPEQIMLPAPGQGALAVVARMDGGRWQERIRAVLHDPDTACAVRAERAFLRALGGGCHVPVGALARRSGSELYLIGRVLGVQGHPVFELGLAGPIQEPESLGERLGERLLRQGAEELRHSWRET